MARRDLARLAGKGDLMAIINRRNAVLGWSIWHVTKSVAKQKARRPAPARGDHGAVKKSAALASIAAAVGGGLWVWRKKSGDTADSSS
jgi:hypothetical protein